MLAVRHLISAFTKLARVGYARRPSGGPSRHGRAPATRLPELPEPQEEGVYGRAGVEPPLEEVLRDPIVRAVMRRDGLEPEAMERVRPSGRRRRHPWS